MQRFKNILFVYEHDNEHPAAFERALTLAEHNQATLDLLEVVQKLKATPEQNGISVDTVQQILIDQAHHALDSFASQYENRPPGSVKITRGTSFVEVIHEVIRHKIDLVIKVAQFEEWLGWRRLSSNDMHLLRKCPCPVWLMKSEETQPSYRNIVAAVDFDIHQDSADELALNRQIIEIAIELALSESSDLHIVHIWDAVGESALKSARANVSKENIDAYIEATRTQHTHKLEQLITSLKTSKKEAFEYVKPRIHCRKGIAHQLIPEFVNEMHAELLVMGTVARSGIPGIIIGNTAETILGKVDCSVIAIKPPGFISPVNPSTSN